MGLERLDTSTPNNGMEGLRVNRGVYGVETIVGGCQ